MMAVGLSESTQPIAQAAAWRVPPESGSVVDQFGPAPGSAALPRRCNCLVQLGKEVSAQQEPGCS